MDGLTDARDFLLGLAAIVSAILVIGGGLALIIRWQVKNLLFTSNGGASNLDITNKIDKLTEKVGNIDGRTERLEQQMDEVVIPRQLTIQKKIGADKRDSDHL